MWLILLLMFWQNQTQAKPFQVVVSSAHSVDLAWQVSGSGLACNVYRGVVKGGPYQKIQTGVGTSYTDNLVVSGTTYYYVVTAVDQANQESGYSNEATAVIP